MTEIVIEKAELEKFIARIMESYDVFGPVSKGGMHAFDKISSPEDMDLSYSNSRLSPKGLFLPQSERMFEFSVTPNREDRGILRETPKEFRPMVVFGIRPCDANAFKLVDVNFITAEYQDPWWKKRREQTTLVGLGCNKPSNSCFCTSVEGGPFSEKGLDMLLYDLDEVYLAKSITDKGNNLLALATGRLPDNSERKKAEDIVSESVSRFKVSLPVDKLKEKDLLTLFNQKFWDEIEFACINCGTCTFLCPTCWCFDIQDEVYKSEGDRLRNWDSCMFPIFTLHGSGHNPRAKKVQRVRQRFMHKLKYYVDKYGDGVACVGCGRCVQFCPVNIDIRRVIEIMTTETC